MEGIRTLKMVRIREKLELRGNLYKGLTRNSDGA